MKPLPEVIATDPEVVTDIINCAANTALNVRPTYGLSLSSDADQNEYIETIFAAFDLSTVYCQAPLNYNYLFHKLISNPGDYHCPVEVLPFEEFPGWDNPNAFNSFCRQWYKTCRERQNHSVITDAYLYFNEPIMGVSICAPVFDKQAVWRGVNCMDM